MDRERNETEVLDCEKNETEVLEYEDIELEVLDREKNETDSLIVNDQIPLNYSLRYTKDVVSSCGGCISSLNCYLKSD